MIDNKEVALHIAGHTEYNLMLSQKRANAVKASLDFPVKNLVAEGMGETQSKIDNDTEENKAKNKRVDIPFNKKEQ